MHSFTGIRRSEFLIRSWVDQSHVPHRSVFVVLSRQWQIFVYGTYLCTSRASFFRVLRVSSVVLYVPLPSALLESSCCLSTARTLLVLSSQLHVAAGLRLLSIMRWLSLMLSWMAGVIIISWSRACRSS